MKQELRKIVIFKDLQAWQEGHKLVLTIYKITKSYPREELYGLVSQMRRCAISITSNIAEGFSRKSYKEKYQFYSIALGSTTELQNQLEISKDVKHIDNDLYQDLFEQSIKVHKIINGLMKKTKSISNQNT